MHTKVPRGYLNPETLKMRSGMAQAVALRKAELLSEDLLVEKQDDNYIVGDYKGRVYQILVTYEEGIDFQSSTDLPSLKYQDYSDSENETPKSVDKEVKPTTTKDRLSSD